MEYVSFLKRYGEAVVVAINGCYFSLVQAREHLSLEPQPVFDERFEGNWRARQNASGSFKCI
jgi:hypothetical protein